MYMLIALSRLCSNERFFFFLDMQSYHRFPFINYHIVALVPNHILTSLGYRL